MQIKPIYEAALGSDGKWYAKGPGWQNGWDSGTLCQHLRVETEAEAKRIAEVANIAFREGCIKTQETIKKALGVI